jgi:hypothetical protein
VRILALRCPCCLQWSEWHLPTAPLRPASVRRTSLCCAGTPRVGLTCRRDGGKEGGKIAMRPLRAQVSLLCCQGTSGRASAKTRERRTDRREREERRERRERERPTKHTRKPTPAPSAKGGGADRDGSRRTGTGRRLVVGVCIASPGRSSNTSRGGTGREQVGRVAPAIWGAGGEHGRPGDGEGVAPGKAGATAPSSLAAN